MVIFSTEEIRTEITAVLCLKKVILAGIGDHLYIFNKNNYHYLQKFKIFDGQKIYGIIPDLPSEKYVLFSEESLTIIQLLESFQIIKILIQKTFSDWILDAQWIDNGQKIATISMHNKFQIWNLSLNLQFERECEDRSILYSAHIFVYGKNIIIFAGTVFSEVLIWNGSNSLDARGSILKRLQGHKGVIFSLNYNESVGCLCSTSDDRSACLWFLTRDVFTTLNETQQIHQIQVYGHASRIFRCKVLQNIFITAGEDSVVNIWTLEGQLQRKIETHQGSPVWALAYDEDEHCLVTGGGNGGITVFPINVDHSENKLELPNFDKPKLIGILGSNNLVAISEQGIFYYFIQNRNEWQQINVFKDLRSYTLLKISICKKLIALAGFQGQIYIYKEEKRDTLYCLTQYQTKMKSRIFSFHWITCDSFLVCQNGVLTLYFFKGTAPMAISEFILPLSKERWITCGILIGSNIIVGDRKGHIHLFEIAKPNPIQTLKKVHSFLGVTNIIQEKEKIITLGRDSVIKTFALKGNRLVTATSDKVNFTWLLDIRGNLLLAFSSNNFIVYDQVNKRLLIDKPCGGGHRSWDFHKNLNDIMFCYIKDKVINITRYNFEALQPKDLLMGFHVYEVNDIEIVNCNESYVLISGGEDTTLRITTTKENLFENNLVLKSHLSSIRAIASYDLNKDSIGDVRDVLFFSAGGRAQIICWKLTILDNNGIFKVECREEHSHYEPLENEDLEVRVMDLLVAEINGAVKLFSACSDGNIQIFNVRQKYEKFELAYYKKIFYKLKCIMKLAIFVIFNRYVLVSMATDGFLTFWDISDLFSDVSIEPFGNVKVHQSGINSYTSKQISHDKFLFLTGGDDNAIALTVVKFKLDQNDNLTLENISSFIDKGTHCAQVTGLHLGAFYFLSASIDQRVALFSWNINNDTITCSFIKKYNTTIYDIKGMKCFERSNGWHVFIYGNGIELLQMKT